MMTLLRDKNKDNEDAFGSNASMALWPQQEIGV